METMCGEGRRREGVVRAGRTGQQEDAVLYASLTGENIVVSNVKVIVSRAWIFANILAEG